MMSCRRMLASIGRHVGQCPRGKLGGVLTYSLRGVPSDVDGRCTWSVCVETSDEIGVYHDVTRRRSVGSKIGPVFSGSWQRRRTASKVKTPVDGAIRHWESSGLRPPEALHDHWFRHSIACSPAQTLEPVVIHSWLFHFHYTGCLAFQDSAAVPLPIQGPSSRSKPPNAHVGFTSSGASNE